MERVNLKKEEKDEVASMERWLRSLSEEQIVEAMSFSFNNDSYGKCHEYDLLVQMLSFQSPPPTPIHPRAMGVKHASSVFATDGRNELQRVLRNRLVRPRLFQFIERQSNNTFDIDQSLASLPPEIAYMVRKENNLGKRRNAAAKKENQYFDVIARKFITSWGQILSLGSTQEMRDADEQMLMSTYIQSGCRLSDSSAIDQRPTWCTFRKGGKSKDWQERCILQMLHVVSRGRAFTCPPKNAKGNYFASWFDPTSEWFSLPAYLASRFEVAMWEIFRSKRDSISLNRSHRTSIEEAFTRLSRSDLQRCISSAFAHALRKGLVEAHVAGKTRDLFLYQYLSTIFDKDISVDFSSDYHSLHLIPFVQLGSPMDRFRLIVVEQCELHVSMMAEAELVRSVSLTSNTDTVSIKSKNRKTKKKKKRNQKQKSKGRVLVSIDEKKAEDYPQKTVDEVTVSALTLPISGADAPNEEETKNTIVVLGVLNDIMETVFEKLGFDAEGDCDDGFLTTQNTEKKNKVEAKKFELKKTKKQSQTSQIPKPSSGDHVDLTGTYLHNEFVDNQLTMKRSNLTSSNSIWNAPPRHTSDTSNLHLPKSGSTMINFPHSQPIKLQHFTSLFIPPGRTEDIARQPDHFFDFPATVDLPIQSDDDILFGMRPYEHREFSLFSDLFDDSTGNHDTNFASSTAASIASSIIDNDDASSLHDTCISDEEMQVDGNFLNPPLKEVDVPEDDAFYREGSVESQGSLSNSAAGTAHLPAERAPSPPPPIDDSKPLTDSDKSLRGDQAPPEGAIPPPPQLSPILVSLADLGELRRRANLQNISDIVEESSSLDDLQPQSSLPDSRYIPKRSFSIEDLRIKVPKAKDDSHIRRRGPPCSSRTVQSSTLSYRNAAMQNVRRSRSVSSHEFTETAKHLGIRKAPSLRSFSGEIREVIIDGSINLDMCAQSESALDDHEDSSHWNVIPKIAFDENDNATTTRDGATTISSIPTPHDIDEFVFLREERDSYRDMCLTMAAEISMLKNILALERINSDYSIPQIATPFGSECMTSFFHDRQKGSSHRYGARSDAGLNNDIPMSEDGTDVMQASVATADKGNRRISRKDSISNNRLQSMSVGKAGGSDVASFDYDNTTYSAPPSHTIPCYRYSGPEHLHGLQSRLTRDMNNFLATITAKLNKQESRLSLAIKRLTTLVISIWPRAQVKMYGSHENNLRLPSSDLDFVICLPNVHKNAPADAPGALEGRNAVNESNQKRFARKLKSESWIGTCRHVL